ncbi:MAG: hypothetical protein E6R04_06425 [Spirochaetes bacterium]|nr:MAG: hypothetical protein E6R04_06425 [Spirochaetota bacterium]
MRDFEFSIMVVGVVAIFGMIFFVASSSSPQYKCTQEQMEWILNKTKDFPERDRDRAYRQSELIRAICDKEE